MSKLRVCRRNIFTAVMQFLMIISVLFTCLLVVFFVGYVFAKGLPQITWELLSTKPSY